MRCLICGSLVSLTNGLLCSRRVTSNPDPDRRTSIPLSTRDTAYSLNYNFIYSLSRYRTEGGIVEQKEGMFWIAG